MRLYHFTVPENPFLIFIRGLEPHIYRADTPERWGLYDCGSARRLAHTARDKHCDSRRRWTL